MNSSRTLLMLVNVDWFFLSHRKEIAQAALQQGYRVVIATTDSGQFQQIRDLGLEAVHVPIDRSGFNPLRELKSLWAIWQVMRRYRPAVVHNVTIKPNIYGSLCSRLLGIPTVNAVSGLGYMFSEKSSGVGSAIVRSLMRIGFGGKRPLDFIFQNKDDHDMMRGMNLLGLHRVHFIKGSGVDLNAIQPVEKAAGPVQVILPARMLWDKGIAQFKAASELLREELNGKLFFHLLGKEDPDNLNGAGAAELRSWDVPGYFQWEGFQEDMHAWLRKAHIVVLPSYYREGMPKSLLEAAAAGLPIVTTDAIGCRECVDEGRNGFKVAAKDVQALASAMRRLVLDPALRAKMGQASRRKAEREFDLEQVVQRHLEIYQQMQQ